MDGHGVGEDEFVEVARVIFDRLAIEGDDHGTCAHVDGFDEADVAIIDVLIVIVAQLHNAVANAEESSTAGDGASIWIELGLQTCVEVFCAECVAAHRGEDLDVLQGVEAELARDARGHEFDGALDAEFGILDAREIEVTFALSDFEWFACVDVVGIADDEAGGILAEDEVEAR